MKVIPDKGFNLDLLSAKVWFIDFRGDTIPYFVEKSEESSNFLVKFEDINSPETAKSISGSSIYLKDKDISIKSKEQEDGLTSLVGYHISAKEELIGIINRIEEYPQQLMAIIENDATQLLIPFLAIWIINIDHESRVIHMDLPEGLIDSQLDFEK